MDQNAAAPIRLNTFHGGRSPAPEAHCQFNLGGSGGDLYDPKCHGRRASLSFLVLIDVAGLADVFSAGHRDRCRMDFAQLECAQICEPRRQALTPISHKSFEH